MYRVLVVSGILLALVVALRADRAEELTALHTPLGDVAPETPVVVYSAGEGIAPLALRGRPMHDAIVLDGALLSTAPERGGVRALRMDEARRIDAYSHFDTARSASAASDLERFARATPLDGLLIVSVAGAFAPQGERAARRRGTLRALFADLGLDADPTGLPSPSLCLVALRRRGGWKLLGAALSNTEPVRLALHVEGSPRRYDDAEPLSIDARLTARSLSELASRPSSNASIDQGSVAFRLAQRGAGGPDVAGAGKGRASVRWADASFGADAQFSCGLLLREPEGRAPTLGGGEIVVDLVLDGELLARERLPRAETSFARPRAWRVPLRRASDAPCQLELRVAQGPGDPPVELLAVRPTVSFRTDAEALH